MPDPSRNGPLPPGRSLVADSWTYPLLACFLLVVLLSFRKIGSYDLGFHLKAGEWIVRHFSFPQKDTFTYTQTGRDYLDSNGLFQVLVYGTYRLLGFPALTLLNSVLVFSAFLVLGLRLKDSKAPAGIMVLALMAAALGMERRFIVRPEVFSWLYLGLTLWILDQRTARKRNWLYWLPLIQWLWVNTEGLFMLGWAALAAYLLSGWVHEKRWDPILARYSLLSVAIGFLNPYGLRGLLFPLTLWTRLQESNPYKQTIAEFLSPWRDLQVQDLHVDAHLHLFLFFILAALVLPLMAGTFRQRRAHEVSLVLVFLLLALKAQRNIPFFLIVALPVAASCLSGWKPSPRLIRFSKPAAWTLSLFALLWCLRVATNAYYVTDRRNDRTGLGLDDRVLPVKAAQFLAQNRLGGRMLNDLDSGGWLDWMALQPTFMDGRLEVPDVSFYRMVLQSYAPGGLIPLLGASQAQLVVLEYNSGIPWVDELGHFSNWRLIYLDESTAVYARSDYAPQVPTLTFAALQASTGIPDSTDPSVESQLSGLHPSSFRSWIRGSCGPQSYDMADFSMGLFALRARDYRAARNFFMEGFRRTTGDYPEVFYNLAVANLRLGDIPLGRECLEYSRQLGSQEPAAVQMPEYR